MLPQKGVTILERSTENFLLFGFYTLLTSMATLYVIYNKTTHHAAAEIVFLMALGVGVGSLLFGRWGTGARRILASKTVWIICLLCLA
ncbi:MAG: hypothetical protein ABI142_14035, partial [Bryocella sp.]